MDIYEYIISETAKNKIDQTVATKLLKFQMDNQINVNKDVAVIGMALQFPNCNNVNEYWNNVCSKTNNITNFPENRKKDAMEFFQMTNSNVPGDFIKGAYMDKIDNFDYDYFGISPLEAKLMDINQRLFLQISVQAIEDAGYGTQSISDTNTGIYIGYSDDFCQEYKSFVAIAQPELYNLSISGNVHSIIASRIAYILNLKGPAMLIDTACSSALTAIHLAVKGLKNGDCELAIVGGAKLSLLPAGEFVLPIASSDGRCRAFDDSSDGTGFGEGVAAVVLKPLDKAISDKDSIYAIIKGSAVNQDGASVGITAPNSQAQAELLEKAWKDAEVEPETISYIETHGTGTKLGDPVEVDGLKKAFEKFTDKKQFCAISSAKSSVGHLDHLAGMASFCKAVMALHKKCIPPTLHFKKPNRNIPFENSPVYVNDMAKKWQEGKGPRRCGVSSFGISGTNCHVILEEYKDNGQQIIEEKEIDNRQIFVLSSKTKSSLLSAVKNNLQYFRENSDVNITDLCFTSQCYRDHHPYRMAFLINSVEELVKKLTIIVKCDELNNIPEKNIYYGYSIVIPDKRQKREGEIYENELQKYSSYANEIIKEGLKPSVMEKLCSLYVKSADINWKQLYDQEYKKVHYPGYSFLQERCWISQVAQREEKHEYGDIKCIARTKSQWVYAITFSPQKSWQLYEHKIWGQPLLPGTVYIEIIKNIASDISGMKSINLSELVFLSPVLCKTDAPVEIFVILNLEDDFIKFRFESEEKLSDESSNWLIHAEGILKNLHKNDEIIDIDSLKKSYFNGNQIKVELENNDEAPISFGYRWDNVSLLSVVENTGLALLELKEKFKDDHKKHKIHPALLDNAVNIAIQSIGDGLYLPWTYKSICIYDDMPDKFYSFIKLNNKDFSNEFVKFDIQLIDENGKVFIETFDYTIKKVNTVEFGKAAEPIPELLSINWLKLEKISADNIKSQDEDIVFFHLENSHTALIEEFRANGHNVFPIKLSSLEQKDFAEILGGLPDIDSIKFVFYLGDYYQEFAKIDGLKSVLDKTLFAFFHFARELIQGKRKISNIDIIFIGKEVYEITGEEKLLQPHYSSLIGLGKVINQEYPNIKCKSLDIDDNCRANDIYLEIMNNQQLYYIGIRQNQRYGMQLGENKIQNYPDRHVKLRPQGVYIITGGIGGIGLEIAKNMSLQEKVHIIFAQRSILPDRSKWDNVDNYGRKIKRAIMAIKEIEENGSSVELFSVDVTNEEQVENLIKLVNEKYATINGIIHAAGLAGVGFLVNKNVDDFKKVVYAKVIGTWLLDDKTRDYNLDFFVLFSSITSILGGMGQSDYTSANIYLDAYSYYRNRRSPNTIVINWGPWKETGMAADYKVEDVLPIKQLSTNGALKAYDIILSKQVTQIWVGSLNVKVSSIDEFYLPLSETLSDRYKNKDVKPQPEKVEQVFSFDDLNPDDVVSLVSSIWERVLEIKQIDIYKNFTQLGGDSIIATYLVKEMEKQFGNIIDITDIFAYPSVSEIASHIINIIEETKAVNNNEKEDSITQSDDDSQENEIRQIDEDAYLDELITKLVEEKDNLENADDILSGGNSGIWKE